MRFQKYSTSYTSFIAENMEEPMHQHEQIELSYLLSGTVTYTMPDSSQTLHPGQVIIHFPYEPHGFSCTEPESRMLTLIFDIDFVPDFVRHVCEYLLPENIFSRKELEISTHEALHWLCHYSTEETEDSSEVIYLKQRGWLTAILGDLFYKHDLSQRTEKLEPDIIRNIIHYMEQNITKDLTSDDLARTAGISQHYLSHNLKQSIFVTHKALFSSVKVAYIENLLVSTNQSLLEVALACGYKNLPAFNRNYKKATGITPREFRKQIQAAEP